MSTKKSKLGGAIFISLGLLFVVFAWGGYFQSKRVMLDGGRAIAKVTDKKIERSRPGRPLDDPAVHFDFDVYYTFETNDGKSIDGRYAIRKETWESLKIGDSIEVVYEQGNPNQHFPVGEGSLVSPIMPAALSVFGLLVIVFGVYLVRGSRPSLREKMPTANPPEDTRILRLLEKIKSDSTAIAFGSYQSHVVFSDGHFIELADSLPAVIEALRDLFTNRLSEDSIKRSVRAEHDEKAEKVEVERKVSGNYQVSTRTQTYTVDGVYYDYLKMRYPRAEVFCYGPARPIAFYQDGILRAVVMPLKR